jgi:hypothetical protein
MEGARMITNPTRTVAAIAGVLCLAAAARAQTPSPSPTPKAATSGRAKGEFDVKMTPAPDDKSGFGRMTADKQYHGDLEGTAKGEMLSWLATAQQGSGVYVAIESVSGTLRGRTGTFLLHHRGVMTRGVPDLSIAVVPDSGTGQLAGLAGKMEIVIAGGKHSYDFEYTLPDTP